MKAPPTQQLPEIVAETAKLEQLREQLEAVDNMHHVRAVYCDGSQIVGLTRASRSGV